jgi:hypothetical protein
MPLAKGIFALVLISASISFAGPDYEYCPPILTKLAAPFTRIYLRGKEKLNSSEGEALVISKVREDAALARVEKSIRLVAPLIRELDFVNCYRQGGLLANRLRHALNRVGEPAKSYWSGEHMTVHFPGDIILDPSVTQMLEHPQIKGIFLGTKADLKEFVYAHPESLADSLWHKRNPDSPTDPQNALKLFWGID